MTTNQDTANGLFAGGNGSSTTTGGNALALTNELTSQAEQVARRIMNEIQADGGVSLEDDVRLSMKSHGDMDAFIAKMVTLADEDIDYLKQAADTEIEKMLRSQQSKRSRSKSKNMTLDNYRTMMTAAIAENLLRMASGKEKSGGGGLRKTDVTYTSEELQELAADQENLKKAIRNVQSKKSIMKSKAGFSETSDEWLQVLEAEQQLKSLRTGGGEEYSAIKAKTSKISDLVDSIDIETLKASDSKELLKKIREALEIK